MLREKVLIAYVPVLHEGYRRFFVKRKEVSKLYLLGEDIIERFRPLVKDIRRLDPELMKRAVESLGILKQVEVVGEVGLKKVAEQKLDLVMPDEDVSRDLVKEFFAGRAVEFDSVFLRWDKTKSLSPWPVKMEIDQEISEKEFDQKMLALAEREGRKTSDWWRAIGGVLVKDGQMLFTARNCHQPSDNAPYENGDPRANFKKGINLELSTSFHAEAALVAEAARRGLSLEGTELYVTDFPCPPCAKLIAYSGIKKLYYRRGYGVLDGVSILQARGVKIIWVK